MNNLDQYLNHLGITDPKYLETLKQNILRYAFKLAVSRLPNLTDADKTLLEQVRQSGELTDETLAKLFASDSRQVVLQAATTEALKMAAESRKNGLTDATT